MSRFGECLSKIWIRVAWRFGAMPCRRFCFRFAVLMKKVDWSCHLRERLALCKWFRWCFSKMKFEIFPKSRFLRFFFALGMFFFSIVAYYGFLPQIERFSVAYRWEQFAGFVRLWVGVFWILLMGVLVVDAFKKADERNDFGNERRDGALFFGAPLLLIVAPVYFLGMELKNYDTLLSFLKGTPEKTGLLLAGTLLLTILLELRDKKNP